jgi:hypothetical protein
MEKFPIGWELADLAETRQIPRAIQKNRLGGLAKVKRFVILGFSFENMIGRAGLTGFRKGPYGAAGSTAEVLLQPRNARLGSSH